MLRPVGNDPDVMLYSRLACNGSKSDTSILIRTLLSCLNVPRSASVMNTGGLPVWASIVRKLVPTNVWSIVTFEFETTQ